MRRMLSSGNYIEYKTIKDTAIIKSFIKTKAYSNQANIESKIDKLIAYEKKRNATKKNYCIKLRVMISRSLSKQQKHELAKQFMFNISLDYKSIPFVYKFTNVGNGTYIDFLVFERKVFTKPISNPKKYKRNMYINKFTGRTCKKDDPNMVMICKKNEIMKDKDGNVIVEKYDVTPTKIRHLWYKDHRDKSIKKRNFNNFIAKLEKFYIVALSKIIISLGKTYKKFKYCRRKFGYSDERLQQINLYNAVINRINLRIILLQDAVFWSDDYDLYNKKLNSLIYSISNTLDNGDINFKNKFRLKLSPLNKNYDDYEGNINYFEKTVNERIEKWRNEAFAGILAFIKSGKKC